MLFDIKDYQVAYEQFSSETIRPRLRFYREYHVSLFVVSTRSLVLTHRDERRLESFEKILLRHDGLLLECFPQWSNPIVGSIRAANGRPR